MLPFYNLPHRDVIFASTLVAQGRHGCSHSTICHTWTSSLLSLYNILHRDVIFAPTLQSVTQGRHLCSHSTIFHTSSSSLLQLYKSFKQGRHHCSQSTIFHTWTSSLLPFYNFSHRDVVLAVTCRIPPRPVWPSMLISLN